MRHRLHLLSCAAVAAILVAGGNQAQAQEQGPSFERSSEEIVVTARRREERLQDVPLSVTALSGDMLQERVISDVASLAKVSPGMNITSSARGNDSPQIILRGQRVIDTSMVLDPPVLFYVNDVPWMRMNGLNFGLYDIENVQVLRGPQGTLFGKSTTGGAVLINTAKASTAGFSGYAKITGGSDDLIRGEGAINIPLSDTLAIRFAATIGRRDGYMQSRNFADLDLNDEHYDGQRVSIHFDDGTITNDLFVSRFSSTTNGAASPIFAIDQTRAAPALLPLLLAEIQRNNADYYSVGNDFRTFSRSKTNDIANTTQIRLSDNLVLKNTIAYRHIDVPTTYDFDGSSVFTRRFVNYTDVRQFSNELQLQGTSTSFDWIFGAFYLTETGEDGANVFVPNVAAASISGVEAKNVSYSAFASGTYRFGIEGLSVSAGIRISHDKRRGDNVQTAAGNCSFLLANGTRVCSYRIRQSSTEPSWSVSLNYKPTDDLLLYVAHRHGYRAGGVQNRATTQASALPFEPETLNDVEIGVKYSGAIGPDARLMLNATAYRGWYKDLQRGIPFCTDSPCTSTSVLVNGFVNAADAIIQGVEAEASVDIGGFNLGGALGFTDAYYKSYSQQITPTVSQDLSDLPFGGVPKWTWDIRAGYTLPLDGDGQSLQASAEAHHVSRTNFNETPQTIASLPSYTVVNARLAWNRVGGSDLSLSAAVTNLTKKEYSTYGGSFSTTVGAGWANRWPAPPRRWEVSALYRF